MGKGKGEAGLINTPCQIHAVQDWRSSLFPCRKDQNLPSPLNCWYTILNQTRQASRDHGALSEIYTGHLALRLVHISEDVGRLARKVGASEGRRLGFCYGHLAHWTRLLLVEGVCWQSLAIFTAGHLYSSPCWSPALPPILPSLNRRKKFKQ